MPSKIEWTEESWNPTVGCTKVSPGCANCYAEATSHRWHSACLKGSTRAKGYEQPFDVVRCLPERLDKTRRRKKATMYFVDSMSDLFHPEVPDSYIDEVMRVMDDTPRHIYQTLTKRAERMRDYFATRSAPANGWFGVSVENKKHGLPRIDALRDIDASLRFLSIEPLLEDLGDINLDGIGWVIVGGESGHGARPMQLEWVENVLRQCEERDVPFFFKQWGGYGADGKKRAKSDNGRLLHGRTYDNMPEVLAATAGW